MPFVKLAVGAKLISDLKFLCWFSSAVQREGLSCGSGLVLQRGRNSSEGLIFVGSIALRSMKRFTREPQHGDQLFGWRRLDVLWLSM